MLSYRNASLADVTALVDLVDSAYRGERSLAGWTTEEPLLGGQRIDAEMLAVAIADPQQVTLLFERERTLVACIGLERRDDYAYLGMVTVSPSLQGKGLGREVLQAAESFAVQQWNRTRARMTVIAQRDELIAWYLRRGYRRTEETAPFPYGDPRFGLPKRTDLYFIVLEKQLDASS
jgi:ribosomal protein S18 acetylase RimI-like enzyme